jgi:hypothetical protein
MSFDIGNDDGRVKFCYRKMQKRFSEFRQILKKEILDWRKFGNFLSRKRRKFTLPKRSLNTCPSFQKLLKYLVGSLLTIGFKNNLGWSNITVNNCSWNSSRSFSEINSPLPIPARANRAIIFTR